MLQLLLLVLEGCGLLLIIIVIMRNETKVLSVFKKLSSTREVYKRNECIKFEK